MTKNEFLTELGKSLRGLPEEDVNRSLDYYEEMIDDQMEDGVGEEDAVASCGTVKECAESILAEIPLPKIIKERVRPKHPLRWWEILLIALGSPVWLPIVLVFAVCVMVVYLVLWTVVAVLGCAVLALFAGGIGGICGGGVLVFTGKWPAGIALIACGLICLGLCAFMTVVTVYAAIGAYRLGKLFLHGMKRIFIGKEKESK